MRLYFVQEEEEVKEILRRLELLSLVQFVFFPLFVNRKRERERMEERRKKGSGKKEEKKSYKRSWQRSPRPSSPFFTRASKKMLERTTQLSPAREFPC